MGLALEEPTGSIIGAAIEVHRALGPGFIEAVCETAFAKATLAIERVPSRPLPA